MKKEEALKEVEKLKQEVTQFIANEKKALEEQTLKAKQIAEFDKFKQHLQQVIELGYKLIYPDSMAPATGNGPPKIQIGNQEAQIQIKDYPPEVISFEPNTLEGKVMWAVWKLNGNKEEKTCTYREISDYLTESRKPISDNSLSPTLGALVKKGNLIKQGTTKDASYRFPKNARVLAT